MKKSSKILGSMLLFLFLILELVGCGNSSTSTTQNSTETKDSKPVTLTISAAASLKDALGEVQKLYIKDNSNVKFTDNFGASGTLQQQIEQGAPTDIFFSAGKTQVDALKTEGLLVDNTITNILKNEVVLVVPKSSTLSIKNFNSLTAASVKKIALGEPKTVPAGKYALDVLTSLKISDAITSKVVYGKDVKEVLTWVETGNADAGIVYATDAKISTKVKVIATAPKNSHKDIVYPAALIKSSKNAYASKKFIKFLSSSSAKKVFEKYGFIISK